MSPKTKPSEISPDDEALQRAVLSLVDGEIDLSAGDPANQAAFEAGLAGEFDRPFAFNDTADPSEIKGYLGYHGLSQWWLETFSASERRIIEEADHERQNSCYSESFLQSFIDFSDEASAAQMGADESDPENDADLEMAQIVFEETGERCEVTSTIVSPTRGQVAYSPDSRGIYLSELAGTLNHAKSRPLALRLADAAKLHLDAMIPTDLEKGQGTSLHFAYSHLMSLFYRSRDETEGALDRAIACAEKMIDVAPIAATEFAADSPGGVLPWHEGYKQLAIIREKQGDLAEAIRLSRAAMSQGWGGDWEKRIARYEKKLAK